MLLMRNALDEQARRFEQERMLMQKQMNEEREGMRQEVARLTQDMDWLRLLNYAATGPELQNGYAEAQGSILQHWPSMLSSTRISGIPMNASQDRDSGRISLGRGRARGRGLRARMSEEPRFHEHEEREMFDGIGDTSLYQQMLDQSAVQHRSLMHQLQAPAVKLSKFSGDPLEFAGFITVFEELVDTEFTSDRAKLMSLKAHCTRAAEAALRCCDHMAASDGYAAARLQRKFGTSFVVPQAWLTKLMNYPALRSPDVMEAFATDLECCRSSLRALGAVSELECTANIRVIVAKLPIYVRNKWRKTHRLLMSRGGGSELDELVTLTREAADDMNDPACSESIISRVRNTYDSTGVPNSRPIKSYTGGPMRRAAAHLVTEQEDEPWSELEDPGWEQEAEVMAVSRQASMCAACSSSQQFTSRCRKYKEMNPEERLTFVKKKALCILCLSGAHSTECCLLPWKCQDRSCGDKHHTSLHHTMTRQAVNSTTFTEQDTTEDINLVTQGSFLVTTSPVLPLTPVVLMNGGKEVTAYALLDPGSTATLCNQRIKDELGLESQGKSSMCVNTVTGVGRMTGDMVRMEIRGINMEETHPILAAMTVEHLPISLNHLAMGFKLDKWPHLRGLDLPMIDVKQVDLLIGQNNAHLLDPEYKIKGKKMEPYALKTPIGWTIYGGLDSEAGEASCYSSVLTEMKIPDDITDRLTKFSEIQEVPECSKLSQDDQFVLDLWHREFRIVNGHVVLPIPFKVDPPPVDNNYRAALQALLPNPS